ncbi:helix-turn-helix domain-containing protein [Yersinia ruckeri]|uniref:helix-turn-helix domain-containing protein n=1 Tax=Yersinia ruckeri TaxID=29486 RepID=UPI0020BE0024|nr:helix-turn-helix domain-containing protein [Yersinia ruckeri]MCK8543191.1 helix-turn-helix domain-containing protein [Yersinia ruckeri]MCK8552774.1 helix-turn-helix domain-containing protein [Yersinia ruckeri]MCW6519796.1 helix-turn-helix domain-containing protein [Yersinia ruckeri]MCW6550958.1 helix-turn-helix domain-containing protein [Yersinia ruckeri]MCW6558332.1 helix-turn-helix domain-containing protein [Yersinia ruckeri]
MNPVEFAVEAVGGQTAAAKICGKSPVAIHKWVKNGCLPRTEYTKKTHYAEMLADASSGKFTAIWLLGEANPDNPEKAAPPAVSPQQSESYGTSSLS